MKESFTLSKFYFLSFNQFNTLPFKIDCQKSLLTRWLCVGMGEEKKRNNACL